MDITLPVVNIAAVMPQLLLVGAATVVLIAGLFEGLRTVNPYLSLILLAVCGLIIISMWGQTPVAFSDMAAMMALDDFTVFTTLVFIAGGLLTVLISIPYARERGIDRGEYYALIVYAVSGMSMMAASVNLFAFFLGLEVLSIALYVLIGFEQNELRSIEGAIKYFLLGAFASGFILYGIALVYGAAGGIEYDQVASHIKRSFSGTPDYLLLGGLGMLLIGIGYKISMAPFHSWTPDVYQGAPTPISAFMSTGSKAAGFAALIRLLGHAFTDARMDWIPLLSGLAILTMAVGNLIALSQTDLKRLLAYSSIAHAGYMLLGLIAGGADGHASIIFYLLVYTLMNLAAFGTLAVLASQGERCYTLEDIAGLGKRHPAFAMVMAVTMFSLAGIPPAAGFVAKFYVFSALIKADFIRLAIVGVLLSGVSLYYYLRVVVWMYMREAAPSAVSAERPVSYSGRAALAVSALALLIIGLLPSDLLAYAKQAVMILQ